MARQFASVESPLEAERLASYVLSMAYPEAIELGDDPDFIEETMVLPLVAEFGKLADREALAALSALAMVSGTEVGVEANHLREQLIVGGLAEPAWASELELIEVVAAAELREPIYDDGYNAILEVRFDSGQTSIVSVLIDNNLGGMAKDILIGESIEAMREVVARHAGEEDLDAVLIDVDPATLADKLLDAISLADHTLSGLTNDSFAEYRSLARFRAFSVTGTAVGGAAYDPDTIEEQCQQALAAFLASDHFADLEDRETAEWLASLAIDFSINYTCGDVLRWSPIKLDMFMTGWVPRKILADASDLDQLPAVMAALIRHAASIREVPETQVAECLAVVEECSSVMRETIEAGEGAGVAHELLTAARDAGVDLADEDELGKFIAGWNARSALEE